jgi:hypothetical protein
MTDNPALSVETTCIWARVLAFLIYARQVTRAFWITDAFRFAIWRVSNHFRQTRTRCLISNDSTDSIWTTWRRLTRISWWRLLNHLNLTSHERIASISWGAATDRVMVVDLTFCIYSASAWTRISTFLIATRFILRTLVVGCTFRSTGWWRSNVSWDTRTNSLTIDLTTLRVRTTWWRLARVCFNWSWIIRKAWASRRGLMRDRQNTYIDKESIGQRRFQSCREDKNTLECDW